MRKPRIQTPVPLPLLPPLPGWAVTGPAETLAAAAFRSGGCLAHLSVVMGQEIVPQALWRARLALMAAEVCVGLVGRREGAGALRDAAHLTRAGDDPGPAGVIWRQCARAVAQPISAVHLGRALDGVAPERIAVWLDMAGLDTAGLDTAGDTPVDRAARVLEAVLADAPRAEVAALVLADAVLARALGWGHILPLLAVALRPRDLRLRGDALRLACHRAVVAGAGQAMPMAGDLARRAVRLQAVVPQLRAKGAGRAIEMMLTRDALVPGALTGFMSDRAARRLCERLVDLGVLRELTGRDTFRLYGL